MSKSLLKYISEETSIYNPIDHPYLHGAAGLAAIASYMLYKNQHKKDNKEKEKIFNVDPKFDKSKAQYNKDNLYK
jgi:hypothetical protein